MRVSGAREIVPCCGVRIPRIDFTVVLLPLPFGPMIVTISPRLTDKLTLSTSVVSPRRTVMSRTSTSGLSEGRADLTPAEESDALAEVL